MSIASYSCSTHAQILLATLTQRHLCFNKEQELASVTPTLYIYWLVGKAIHMGNNQQNHFEKYNFSFKYDGPTIHRLPQDTRYIFWHLNQISQPNSLPFPSHFVPTGFKPLHFHKSKQTAYIMWEKFSLNTCFVHSVTTLAGCVRML